MRDSRAPYTVDVTFDYKRFPGLKANPVSYEEHLMWATEYTLRQRGLRAQERLQVRNSLMACSVPQLRAVFLFAVFERKREVEVHRGRLDEPQRAALWIEMLKAGLVRMGPKGFMATRASANITANLRNAYAIEPPEQPAHIRAENDWTTMD
ncbi:hypothetical protein SEA_YARA_80 [Streptomyces phage Yara]|nr:hypothetical protein SEA_YARA_80 [Streptomyces phage Yara]